MPAAATLVGPLPAVVADPLALPLFASAMSPLGHGVFVALALLTVTVIVEGEAVAAAWTGEPDRKVVRRAWGLGVAWFVWALLAVNLAVLGFTAADSPVPAAPLALYGGGLVFALALAFGTIGRRCADGLPTALLVLAGSLRGFAALALWLGMREGWLDPASVGGGWVLAIEGAMGGGAAALALALGVGAVPRPGPARVLAAVWALLGVITLVPMLAGLASGAGLGFLGPLLPPQLVEWPGIWHLAIIAPATLLFAVVLARRVLRGEPEIARWRLEDDGPRSAAADARG